MMSPILLKLLKLLICILSNIRNVILAGDLNIDFSCKNAHGVYFNVSSCLYGLTQCVQRCNLPLNPSKHIPTLIHMNVDILHRKINEVNKMGGDKPLAWHRERDAEEDSYRKGQNWILKDIVLPDVAKCKDI